MTAHLLTVSMLVCMHLCVSVQRAYTHTCTCAENTHTTTHHTQFHMHSHTQPSSHTTSQHTTSHTITHKSTQIYINRFKYTQIYTSIYEQIRISKSTHGSTVMLHIYVIFNFVFFKMAKCPCARADCRNDS